MTRFRLALVLVTIGGCQSTGTPNVGTGSAPSAPDSAVDLGAPVDLPVGDGTGGSGGANAPADSAAPVDLRVSETALPEAGGDGGDAAGNTGTAGPCGALFCESFEDVADGAPPDPAIWTRTSQDIVVDSTRGAHGSKKSLHIPPLLTGAKYIRENKTILTMGTAFYGRVYLWIEQQPKEKPATLYHWTLLSADQLMDFNAGKVLRLGGHIEGAGTNWVRFNFQTHGMPGETGLSDPQLILSPQKWYCFEFYYSLADNEARFWLDGVEDPKLHWKGPMNGYVFPTAVTWMTFGWAEYQAARTPWEVWIDEIALDTKKIGCN